MSRFLRLGLLHSLLRPEEKSILSACRAKGIEVVPLRDRDLILDAEGRAPGVDGVLNRCISHYHSLYATRFLEHAGLPVVNRHEVIAACGDKALTSLLLAEARIPNPRTLVALDPASALRAIDEVGYPAVLKPVVGSWGRLMARVPDRATAEALVEHKAALGNPLHSIFYVQEFVEKPGRDIRVLVAGRRVVAAMYREADHWITNAARGGTGSALFPEGDAGALALRAAKAVGGGILAVDLMESPRGLLVHEVNHTPEFKELALATGVDVAGAMVDYLVEVVG